jgi:hypothetical protein
MSIVTEVCTAGIAAPISRARKTAKSPQLFDLSGTSCFTLLNIQNLNLAILQSVLCGMLTGFAG